MICKHAFEQCYICSHSLSLKQNHTFMVAVTHKVHHSSKNIINIHVVLNLLNNQ